MSALRLIIAVIAGAIIGTIGGTGLFYLMRDVTVEPVMVELTDNLKLASDNGAGRSIVSVQRDGRRIIAIEVWPPKGVPVIVNGREIKP